MSVYCIDEEATATLFDAYSYNDKALTPGTTIRGTNYTLNGMKTNVDLVLGNLRESDKIAFTVPNNCTSWVRFLAQSKLQRFLTACDMAMPHVPTENIGICI